MTRHQLIIDRPELQSWRQRAVFGGLTMLFWMFWLLLWLPLITLLGWVFFGLQVNLQMVELGGFSGFQELLLVYSAVILVMGGSLILWAKYNHFRFRGVDRRKLLVGNSIQDISGWTGQDLATVRSWRKLRSMRVTHGANGNILHIQDLANADQRPDESQAPDAPLSGERSPHSRWDDL